MVRLASRWLFLLCLASCGAVLVRKVITDVHEQFPSPFLSTDILKEVRWRPVSLTDFRKQLSETKSYYDLFRIFFDEKSISNREIDELLTTRATSQVPGHVFLREVSSFDENTDEDYPAYGDYALQDPGSSIMEDLARAYEHFEEMENSPMGQCKYPQPEVIHVRGEGDSKNKLYFPECTVVYRCRNVSGCCHNASEECGPKTIQVISKAFFVIEMTGRGQVQPDDTQMVETRDFINHTECGCKEIKGLPACKKRCPPPFVRTRPGIKCACDCHEENEGCVAIKQGMKPLDEHMLKRLKDGTYARPSCEDGEFNVRSGYCPRVAFTRTHRRRHKGHRAKSKGHNSKHYKDRKRTPKTNQQINS